MIEPIERWNPEIEKYLEHKFECYYQYEGAKVVAENAYVRITVIHKYTCYTVGKFIKFHRKSTLTLVLDKTIVRTNTSCGKSTRIPHISFESK